LESSTMAQQPSCCQSNQDDCKQWLLGTWHQLITLDPVDMCFMDYMKQQTQSKAPDPDEEFLHSPLWDIKSMTAKQKCTFEMAAVNWMDEILEDIGSDQWSSTGLSKTSTVYHMTSLQEVWDNSQSLLTYWEME
jgi:hypothetical protein